MDLFDKKFVYLEWDDVLEGEEVFVADSFPELRRRVENGNYKRIVKKHDGDYPFVTSSRGARYAMVYYDPNYECKVAYAQGKVIQYRNLAVSDYWSDVDNPQWLEWLDTCEYRVKPEAEPCKFRVYKCSDDTLHICNSCITDSIFKGTEVECKQYIKEHYCDRCTHQSCDMVLGTQFCKGFEEVVVHEKRRMTNRELAKWLAQGNGECLQNTIAFTVWNYLTENKDKTVSDSIKIRGWDETEWSEPLMGQCT